ncbi:MAG: cell division protein FtsA [Patescibacteria group bacterium]
MPASEKREKLISLTKKIFLGRGLDVGTAFIYCAQKTGPQVTFKTQRNAFFDIEYSEFTQGILEKSDIKYILSKPPHQKFDDGGKDKIYIVGNDAIKFANVFGRSTRRPLKRGVISPEETEALPIMELIIKSVLHAPVEKDEIVYYSVPSAPVDAEFNTVYHQNIIRGFLEKWGYQARPLNEGLAVIFSELAEDNFTGMGISFGGGMANVCLALMSSPVFSFSVTRAGDWIDEQVAIVTNTSLSKITTFKENFFTLKKSESSMTKIEQALSIYYDHLIEYVLDEIKKEIAKNTSIPKFEKPIPIVISGGTANPPGFIERFKEMFQKIDFPLEVREVRLAPNPLYTVAKGTLIAAIANRKSQVS